MNDYDIIEIDKDNWGILIDGVTVRVNDISFDENEVEDMCILNIDYNTIDTPDNWEQPEHFEYILGRAVQEMLEEYIVKLNESE